MILLLLLRYIYCTRTELGNHFIDFQNRFFAFEVPCKSLRQKKNACTIYIHMYIVLKCIGFSNVVVTSRQHNEHLNVSATQMSLRFLYVYNVLYIV